MKHSILSSFLLIITLAITSQSFGQCDPKPIVKANKKGMKPYSLDTYTDNELVFGKEARSFEIPFTAYSGDQYKLLFVPDQTPQEMTIAVYDRNIKSASRKQLYISHLKPGGGMSEPFLINKPGNYYIQFDVPVSADGAPKKMCLVTLIGFKEQE
jgi:hypothetical protein